MQSFRPLPLNGTPDDAVATDGQCVSKRWEFERDVARVRRWIIEQSADELVLVAPERWKVATVAIAAWAEGCCLVLCPNRSMLAEASKHGERPIVTGDEDFLQESASVDRAEALDFEIPCERIVVELLTSGTTGRPELHRKNARQLLGEADAVSRHFEMTRESTVFGTVSSHHIYGLLFGVLAPLKVGARLVTHPAADPRLFNPLDVASAVHATGATHLITVPAHLRGLIEQQVQLETIAQVVSSAAPLAREWAKQLEQQARVAVFDMLGSTETGGIGSRRPALGLEWTPLPGVAVSLGDEERMIVRSPFLSDAISPQLTGDRARLLSDGRFLHLGRDDGVVKVGGKRTSLQEVEERALEVAGVRDAYALAHEVEGLRGMEIWLAVSGDDLERRAVRTRLREVLDPVFVPRKIRILPVLPRNQRGKVEREELLSLFERETFDVCSMRQTEKELILEAKVQARSRRFDGHFPGHPIVPAVALLADLLIPEAQRLVGGELEHVTRAKWRLPLLPGQMVEVKLAVLSPPATASSRKVRFEVLTSKGASAAVGTLAFRSVHH